MPDDRRPDIQPVDVGGEAPSLLAAPSGLRIPARLRPLGRWARSMAYVGNRRECSCCGGRFRAFLPTGRPPRPEGACPGCGSFERQRLLALYLNGHLATVPHERILHFAPERALMPMLRALATEYLTTDLVGDVDLHADITDLPFEDGRWDLVICSHVLEHIPDDAAAMGEILRVVGPSGRAIIVVPRATGRPTDEDPSVTDPAERHARFGQVDHVRLYGDDFESRLERAGFQIFGRIDGEFSPAQVDRFRLAAAGGTDEVALLCGLPAASS